MRKPLFIYGAGGLGREVLSMIQASEEWEPRGFIDDGVAKNTVINGLKVLGGSEVLSSFTELVSLIFAVGDPLMKAKIVQGLRHKNVIYPVLIHPKATLQHVDSIRIGAGAIITAGTVLTTNIDIGQHVLINLNTTIGHDSSIGPYSSVMPGVNIAGEVIIGEAVLIGSGSNILNRVRIGSGARVGMGTVVIHDVEPGQTVVGVPAKPIQS